MSLSGLSNELAQVPDGDTLGRFGNRPIRNGLQKSCLPRWLELLRERGLLLKKGSSVDSTIISAPSSTKIRENSGYLGVEKREDAVVYNQQGKRIRYSEYHVRAGESDPG